MIITTDDLNQQDWSLFEYFDKLKEEFPKMEVLAFFTPFWKDEKLTYIKEEFINFLIKRKDWLFLASHGLFHNKAEYSLDYNTQTAYFSHSNLIKEHLQKKGIKYFPYCKPPYYKFNEIGFELARKYFTRMHIQSSIMNFAENKFYPREEIGLIDSHVSTGCPMPDRIDKFYKNLRLILKGEIKDEAKFHYG